MKFREVLKAPPTIPTKAPAKAATSNTLKVSSGKSLESSD
jgi:hypothetical protein